MIYIVNIIYNNKWEISISAIVFLGSFLMGLFITFDPSIVGDSFQLYITGYTAMTIIKNNLHCSMLMVGGNLTCGIMTIILLFINGIVGGLMIKTFMSTIDLFTIIIKTVPHCIFEFPAIIFSGAIGLKVPMIFIKLLKNIKISLFQEITEAIKLYVFVIVLFVIAGFIEGSLIPFICNNIEI